LQTDAAEKLKTALLKNEEVDEHSENIDKSYRDDESPMGKEPFECQLCKRTDVNESRRISTQKRRQFENVDQTLTKNKKKALPKKSLFSVTN
jgi:hypothetical protein